MNRMPLVSICVITYNSSKFVLETLESAKKQTYKNIELIVSDDASIDSTVEICEKWIKENNSRFVNARVITTNHNSGTSSNCNRVIQNAAGEWIKIIAGDDILLDDCIEKCVRFVNEHPSAKWMVGKTLKYENLIDDDHLIKNDTLYTPQRLSVLKGSLEEQRLAILNYTFIEAPALFINTNVLKNVGGYDEKYRLLEDWPMYMKLLKAGYKCYFLDDFIVGYRQSDNSVFNVRSKPFNFVYKESLFAFERDELFVFHSKAYRINKTLHYKLCCIYQKLSLNRSNRICKKVYSFLSCLIDRVIKIS